MDLNSKSPVSFWVVLIIGVAILSSIYLGGRSPLSQPGLSFTDTIAQQASTPAIIAADPVIATSVLCASIARIDAQSHLAGGASYTRLVTDHLSLYLVLPTASSQHFVIYRSQNQSNCAVRLGEIPALGFNGILNYDAALLNNNIVRLSYSDGDLGGSLREAFYVDIAKQEIVLSYRTSQDRTVYFTRGEAVDSIAPWRCRALL